MGTIQSVPESPADAALREFEDLVYSDARTDAVSVKATYRSLGPGRHTAAGTSPPG